MHCAVPQPFTPSLPGSRRRSHPAGALCAAFLLLSPLAAAAAALAGGALANASATPDAPAPAALPVVNVVGKTDSATEGTASLGARSASLFKGDQHLRDIPQPVTVLTRQLLEERKLLDLHDVLQATPGVAVDYTDSERVSYNARGFSIDALQVDGLTINQSGSSFVQPDTAVLDRVEVLRGASGMLRGAGNPSATVNMVRKRPTREFAASAAFTLGSWQRRRLEADLSAPLNAAGTVRGRVVAVKDQKEFFQDAKQEDREVLYAVVEADLGARTTLTGSLQHTDLDATGAWGGMPGNFDGSALDLPRETYLGSDWNRWNRYNDQGLIELAHRFANGWNLKASAAYTHLALKNNGFKQTYMARPAGATDPNLMTVTTAQYTGNESDQRALALAADGGFSLLGRRHTLLLGMEQVRARTTESWGIGNLYPETIDIRSWNPFASYAERAVTMPTLPNKPNTTTQSGAYATARLSLSDPLTAIAGVRLSWWKYASEGAPSSNYRVERQVTPYAGLVFDISDALSAYASYTEIFTPQNVKDANGNILEPITGEDYELGLKGEWFGGRLTGSLGLFQIDNLGRAIEDPSSRNPCLPYFTSGYCRVAGGAQRSEGWEAELAGEVLPGWEVMAGYTNTRTKYLRDSAANTGQPLRSIDPRHQLRLFTSYSADRNGPGWTVGGGLQVQSSSYMRSGAVTSTQGGYTVANAMLGYRFSDKLELQLNVDNLFDKVYYKKFAPTGIGYYYGDPRNVALTLRAAM